LERFREETDPLQNSLCRNKHTQATYKSNAFRTC